MPDIHEQFKAEGNQFLGKIIEVYFNGEDEKQKVPPLVVRILRPYPPPPQA